MDDKAEDWQKWKRIKAERDKAAREAVKMQEDKSNLAYIDARSFLVRKGFSSRPEAFLTGGERMANAGIVLAILGVLGDKILEYFKQSIAMAGSFERRAENDAALRAINYLQSSFQFLVLLAPLLVVGAIASAIWYRHKTKQKVWHIFISASIAIGVVLLDQGLTLLIAKLSQS